MRCEACFGTGKGPKIAILPEPPDTPCPECNGSGIAHCCDGLQEQPPATQTTFTVEFVTDDPDDAELVYDVLEEMLEFRGVIGVLSRRTEPSPGTTAAGALDRVCT